MDKARIDETLVTRFMGCKTKEDRDAEMKSIAGDAQAIVRGANRARTEARKRTRRAELDKFHQIARRWKQGQKVYFGVDLQSIALDWNFRSVKGSEKNIKKGEWCRVWQYQSKAKQLWLCRPGTKCEYKNVIRDSFSLADIQHHRISRTELAIRKV